MNFPPEAIRTVSDARKTGEQFIALINEKSNQPISKEMIQDLLTKLIDLTACLPEKRILFDEFIRIIHCKFAFGAANTLELHTRMKNIVVTYLAEFEKIEASYLSMNQMLSELIRQQVNPALLTGLQKTANQLEQFMKSAKSISFLHLDNLQNEVLHLQSKLRKVASYEAHFRQVFKDYLSNMTESSTVAATRHTM
jgi:hypothetical protein